MGLLFFESGFSELWRICRIGMMRVHCFHPLLPCQALGQALVSSAVKGEGDSVGWVGLVVCPSASPLDCGSSPQ